MTPSLPDPVLAALTDPQLVSLTVWAEGRGEPIEGQVAIGCVLRNRVDDGRWGASYARVCLAPAQFSCWSPTGGVENHAAVIAMARHIATSSTLPDDEQLRQAIWIATGVIGRWILDLTRHATHYYAPASMQVKGAVPRWAVGLVPTTKKGGHLFFTGVR